jgi:hypothetical protein
MLAPRLLLPIAACLAAVSQPGCGYSEKGLGPPDIGIGPVAPLQVEIDNPSDQDVFIDWADSHAHFDMLRSGQKLMIDKTCLPACSDSCACIACDPPAKQVLRIPANQSVSFSWPAEHFVQSSCDAGESCVCIETWPLTAGKYDIVVDAYTSIEGGTPSDEDPDVIVGASVDTTAPGCKGSTTFSLAPSAAVHAELDCSP